MRSGRALAAVSVLSLGLAAVLSGCAGQPAAEPSETEGPAPFLIDQDFPDPDILEADGEYYAFATNSPAANVQFATSPDLVEWDLPLEDALPDLPDWASEGRTWAPDVSAQPDGGYIMYFVAAHTASDKQCIGAATATDVTGPYTPVAGEPLVCALEEGGAIDPASFTDDDGSRYLLWKNDGNCCALDTWVQLTPLTPDGTAAAGPATKLFQQTEAWEGNLVEAPVLVKHDDSFVIFYSANDYGSDQYAVGVASSTALTGPYEKQPGPFLSSEGTDDRYLGPGGQDVITTDDGDVMLFHGWNDLYMYRGMYSLPLEWDGAVPQLVMSGS